MGSECEYTFVKVPSKSAKLRTAEPSLRETE